jgi:predicted neutral ceramidase superfamily lipid hydrolase
MDARDFKKFSFVGAKGPGIFGIVVIILLTGALLALASESILEPRLAINPILFAALFTLLNLGSGTLIDKGTPEFKAKWSYLIILISQIAFIAVLALLRLSTRISFLDSLILWTAFSYTVWMVSLNGLGALRIGARSISLSFLQPALVWLFLAWSLEAFSLDLIHASLLLASLAVSTLIILFNEHIFSLVFVGMSGMAELSKFLKGIRGEDVSLDIGDEIDVPVQYMMFKSGDQKNVLIGPWLHSGPIRSVGGGDLSSRCIEKLNDSYGNSYFFHMPTNHEYNPAGKMESRVVESISEGKYQLLMASQVIDTREGDMKATGQRLNDLYLISLSCDHIDDYDPAAIEIIRNKHKGKKIMIIDSHPNPPMKTCSNVQPFSKDAYALDRLVSKLVDRLSKDRLRKAKIGTSILKYGDYSLFALIIEAREKTLYFIEDTNGLTDAEQNAIQKEAKLLGINRVISFSTDTHSLPLKALINRPDTPPSAIRQVISEAISDLKEAKFYYGESLLSGVRVFGEAYYELATMVRILSRVIPVLFLLMFIFLTILLWIF